jgi:hypothetical protein
LQALKAGSPRNEASEYASVNRSTFYSWLAKSEGARSSVAQAEASGVIRNLALINKAAETDWRAAAWFLEHRYPEQFARSRTVESVTVETEGADGNVLGGPRLRVVFDAAAAINAITAGSLTEPDSVDAAPPPPPAARGDKHEEIELSPDELKRLDQVWDRYGKENPFAPPETDEHE